MKKPSLQLILSTGGVLAILAIGLFSVNCGPITIPGSECRDIQGDFTTTSTLTTPNLVMAGDSFQTTITINVGEEFSKRYSSVPIDDLKAYYVTLAQANFTSDRCSDLSFYEISVSFPGHGAITERNRCDFPEFQNVPNPSGSGDIAIYFSKDQPGTNTTAQAVLNTNFAQSIKDREAVTATIKFGAKNDIPAGFGVNVLLHSNMEYTVCD